jgi:carboxyl-terminal processing protease
MEAWEFNAMSVRYRNLPSILIVLLTLILAACSAQRPPFASNDDYPLQAAKEVFTTGYKSIHARYIEVVTPGQFAIEGLHGLGSIDPAITIEEGAGDVVVKISGVVVERIFTPSADDAEGWAELTVQVTALGRQHSREMRKASAEKIYEAVFDGILSSLDIYSRYAGSVEAKRNRAKRNGFGGIGVLFQIVKNTPQVILVLPNTPALKAGILIGDRITHADKKALAGLKQVQVSKQLQGPIHSEVILQIERKGENAPFFVKLERAHIIPDTVSYSYKNGIVYLKISTFNQRTARNLLDKLKKARGDLGDDITGIVLDMRGNTGGLLKQSIQAADLFLAQGQISETRGRHPDSMQSYDAGGHDMAYGRPVVVLIDGNSASAAEVAAAALQDHGRAVVIGTASFGKGTVQTVIRLPNEGEITLTWSRLIAPSGFVLHGLGVYPTICTSSIDGNRIDGEAIIARAFSERIKTTAVMEGWRRTSFQEVAQRQKLRTFCPPERRKLQLDRRVAEALLNNKALYSRILNLSTSAAATR